MINVGINADRTYWVEKKYPSGYVYVDVPMDFLLEEINEDFTFNQEKYVMRKAKEKRKTERIELKAFLKNTDYIASKLAEAQMNDILNNTHKKVLEHFNEYKNIYAQREQARIRINILEKLL